MIIFSDKHWTNTKYVFCELKKKTKQISVKNIETTIVKITFLLKLTFWPCLFLFVHKHVKPNAIWMQLNFNKYSQDFKHNNVFSFADVCNNAAYFFLHKKVIIFCLIIISVIIKNANKTHIICALCINMKNVSVPIHRFFLLLHHYCVDVIWVWTVPIMMLNRPKIIISSLKYNWKVFDEMQKILVFRKFDCGYGPCQYTHDRISNKKKKNKWMGD